jgi:hypothetical protein
MTPEQTDRIEEFLGDLEDDDILYTAVFYVTEDDAGLKGFGGFADEEQRKACAESLRLLADQLENRVGSSNGHTLQ